MASSDGYSQTPEAFNLQKPGLREHDKESALLYVLKREYLPARTGARAQLQPVSATKTGESMAAWIREIGEWRLLHSLGSIVSLQDYERFAL